MFQLSFVPPETALDVPYSKRVVFRIEYEIPAGYLGLGTIWIASASPDAENLEVQSQDSYEGKGVGYNSILLQEGGKTRTLKSVKVAIYSSPTVSDSDSGWLEVCTTAVNLTFKEKDASDMPDLDHLKEQFKVSVTGVAVVDDNSIFEDDAAVANVVFASPQTPLSVPYGKSVLIRMSYDFPAGYAAQLWTTAAQWSAAPGGNSYHNLSDQYVGKGTAYGFIGLEGHSASCTLEAIRVDAGAYLTDDGERTVWGLCTTPVNITFSR